MKLWTLSPDGKKYSGEYPSEAEAIADAPARGAKPGGSFFVGEALSYEPRLEADIILDRLYEQACDEVGKAAVGDWLEGVRPEAMLDLEDRLTEVLREWMAEQGLEPGFYLIERETRHVCL